MAKSRTSNTIWALFASDNYAIKVFGWPDEKLRPPANRLFIV